MWNWIKKGWSFGKKALGKAKGGLEQGLKIFNKTKELYGDVKARAGSLPFVGQVASELIREAEGKIGQVYAEKTGRDLMKDVGMAEGLAQKAQKGLGVAEGIVRRVERSERRVMG
jgi:uncharacterized protein YjbJ (UPF0337 family)